MSYVFILVNSNSFLNNFETVFDEQTSIKIINSPDLHVGKYIPSPNIHQNSYWRQ